MNEIALPRNLRILNKNFVVEQPTPHDVGAGYQADYDINEGRFRILTDSDPQLQRWRLFDYVLRAIASSVGEDPEEFGRGFFQRVGGALVLLILDNFRELDLLYDGEDLEFPDCLKVGPLVYLIHTCEELVSHGLGQNNLQTCLITLKGRSAQGMRETLMHEVVHGILDVMGEGKLSETEPFVERLTNALDLFFQENWEAVCGMFPEAFA